MGVKFFKPEDFLQPEQNVAIAIPHETVKLVTFLANAKLEREGVRVIGNETTGWHQGEIYPSTAVITHTALLVGAEELPNPALEKLKKTRAKRIDEFYLEIVHKMNCASIAGADCDCK